MMADRLYNKSGNSERNTQGNAAEYHGSITNKGIQPICREIYPYLVKTTNQMSICNQNGHEISVTEDKPNVCY